MCSNKYGRKIEERKNLVSEMRPWKCINLNFSIESNYFQNYQKVVANLFLNTPCQLKFCLIKLYFTFVVLLSSSFMRIRIFFAAVFLIQTFYAEGMENIKRNLKNHCQRYSAQYWSFMQCNVVPGTFLCILGINYAMLTP